MALMIPIIELLRVESSRNLPSQASGRRLLGIPKGPNPAAYIRADFDKAKVVAVTADTGKATWHSLRKLFINNA